MTPQTVNAYYNPTTNEICFPAGILQPPFFDAEADDAFNYGAIGVVIGHEMTHGFDDQGRRYDKDGNMKDWWTPEDSDSFNKRANVMKEFFNNIKEDIMTLIMSSFVFYSFISSKYSLAFTASSESGNKVITCS